MAEVRKELLSSPWTDEDELVREYLFANDASLEEANAIWEFQNSITNVVLSVPICFWPCQICTVLNLAIYKDTKHRLFYENKIEELWARRVGITNEGIVFKQLRKKPLSYDDGQNCSELCCRVGRFPKYETGGITKVVPFDRVQDVLVEDPAGGTERVIQLCGCCAHEVGEYIPNVDSVCQVDTSGAGIELTLPGLANAKEFRQTVIALKNRKPIPTIGEGVLEGTAALNERMKAPLDRCSSKVRQSSNFMNPAYGPSTTHPGMMEMSRTSEDQVALLRSIDDKLGKLISIAATHGHS
ncbi:hypothetical protein CYMTET_10687 [Cymbomonas tetramitiformis]|uniref:Uncharacterized protein n=1 Tax=Cymbomonas tetramitiformis TaxID=36881 RepID=A0AAE0GNV6_9CHLO|nr:hypothetical protein CYMTET_10687 [Cymbomonas tetramitiformis]|eukprot:gene25990-31819_t